MMVRDGNGGVALPAFPPGRAGPSAARTALLPTAWGGPPSLGSPPWAAAAPHPVIPCKPLPVPASERDRWAASSLAQGPEPHS